jgi:hypothetical protein
MQILELLNVNETAVLCRSLKMSFLCVLLQMVAKANYMLISHNFVRIDYKYILF